MIKNLVFDMGNVLIHWSADRLMDGMGVKDEEDRKILVEEMFHSSEWLLLDWGQTTEDEVESVFRSRIPSRLWSCIHNSIYWENMIYPVEGMADFIKGKKEEGYSIYLLSNAPARCHDFFHLIPGSQYFDGVVFSGAVRMVKPESDIFFYLAERYSLNSGECLFVDDLEENVRGAERCGFYGHVFKGDPAEIEEKLSLLQA